MNIDKGILIRNVYYMLSYAFQYLKEPNYKDLGKESFENIYDLFSKILTIGLTQQLKQGLYKEYVSTEDNLSTVRGKINIQKSIPLVMQHRQKLNCEFDEFSENNIFNSVIKTTGYFLLKHCSKNQREELYTPLSYLSSIDEIDISSIHWNTFRFHKNNRNYEMLINICHLIIDNCLINTDGNEYKLLDFFDEDNFHKLFEKFVLNYYIIHYPQLNVKSSEIKWDIDEPCNLTYLPKMITDITISDKKSNKVLIIDTKYYGKTMQKHFDKVKFHNGNLYQILSYVKNEEANSSRKVAGMLLYAKTNEAVTPNESYKILGNEISVKTLDLNVDFKHLSLQLDNIVNSYFF